MSELKTAITIVGVILAVAAAMELGDYLGYKMGRKRLAAIVGFSCLAAIVVFTVYAAVVLLRG